MDFKKVDYHSSREHQDQPSHQLRRESRSSRRHLGQSLGQACRKQNSKHTQSTLSRQEKADIIKEVSNVLSSKTTSAKSAARARVQVWNPNLVKRKCFRLDWRYD